MLNSYLFRILILRVFLLRHRPWASSGAADSRVSLNLKCRTLMSSSS